MSILEILQPAIRAAPIGMSEIARRSGMSRAHLYRIVAGAVEPRITDAREIALACGYDLRLTAVPASEPLAAVAARLLLGDTGLATRTTEAADWMQRLTRTGGDRAALLDAAGHAASLLHRPDGVGLSSASSSWDVDRLVSAGIASEQPWALSGWAALNAMGHEIEAPTVFWTPDVRLIAQLLADTFTIAPTADAQILVLPADPSVFVGTVDIQQVVLVDPVQTLIDAAGLGLDISELAGAQR